MRVARIIAALFLMTGIGCVSGNPVNPSFPVTVDQARQVLVTAISNPKPLKRPLVIVGGFADPGFAAFMLSRDFQAYTHDDRVIGVPLGLSVSEEEFRRRIIDCVDRAFPTSDPAMTTEVDVVG